MTDLTDTIRKWVRPKPKPRTKVAEEKEKAADQQWRADLAAIEDRLACLKEKKQGASK